jgi:succinate dehydrogenase/fumarate reductase flavoprotein subunit
MREEPGIPPAGLPVDDGLPDRVGVLVLGGGLAGAAALLAAAEAGQYAVLLEKTAAFGGSTVRSAGLSALVGTDEQVEQGFADSLELLRKDLLEVGGHVNDEALVDLYCDEQLATYRWLKGCATATSTRPRASRRHGRTRPTRRRCCGRSSPPRGVWGPVWSWALTSSGSCMTARA